MDINLDRQHVQYLLIHAIYPRPCCISMSMLHDYVHDACPFFSMPIVAKIIIFSIVKLLETLYLLKINLKKKINKLVHFSSIFKVLD